MYRFQLPLVFLALGSIATLLSTTTALDASIGWGHSLYFPFGGEAAAGMRNYFRTGDFTSLTLDYWAKNYGGSSLQHMARTCQMTFITSSDTNYLQTFQNEYKTIDDANSGGTVADYDTMALRYFHRMSGPSAVKNVKGALDWARWTVTVSETSLKLFVNGTKIYDVTYDEAKPLELTTEKQAYFTLGQYTFLPGQTIRTTNFYGQIDELYMYNAVVSEADIQANWQKKRITPPATSSPVVYHSFEAGTEKVGGTSGKYFENQGSGGSTYDLFIGGHKDSDQFTDSNTLSTFPGVKPFRVASTVPFTDADEADNDVATVTVLGYTFDSSSNQYVPQETKIVFPHPIEITFLPSGSITDVTGNAITTPSLPLTSILYKPVATGATAPSSTLDLLNYIKNGNNAPVFTLGIHVPTKVTAVTSTNTFKTTPVEDKAFSMNVGCNSDVGSRCTVKLLADTESCIYQTKFMSNEPADFNIGDKAQVGDVLNGPGYSICKLVNDREGTHSQAVRFEVSDLFGTKVEATADYEIQSVDDVPISKSQSVTVLEDQDAKKVTLEVIDPETDKATIVITKLPTKGKLYFENKDGTVGGEITKPFTPWSAKASTFQYALNVTGVSSFWGNGQNTNYHPIQILGEPSIDTFGDSIYAWSPLWKAGDGGSYTEGGDSIVSFKHDPIAYFAQYGAYEYIEVNFTKPLYLTSVEIGENRGMGSIVRIKTWSDEGSSWYNLWEGTASNAIQEHHAKFGTFRQFGPSICEPPLKSNKVRIEMDTVAVPDWNELDYVKVFGSEELPDGTLEFPSKSVYYKPNKDAYGDDSFEFSAYDCPYDRYRRSNTATVSFSITQVNDAPELAANTVTTPEGTLAVLSSLEFVKNQDDDIISIKVTKLSDSLDLFDGSSRITSLPYTGELDKLAVNVTNCKRGEIEFTMKDAATPESSAQTVSIEPSCFSRPPACSGAYWNFVVSNCDSNNERKGTYSWKNPSPENSALPTDCCILDYGFGDQGALCIEGSRLPSNFTFDCEYIVADSPVSIAMLIILILAIMVLFLLIVIYGAKTQEKTIKRSQPIFIILANIGAVVGLLTPFWMIGEPNDATCALTPITVFFGITLMYSAFLSKMIRIDLIFNNQAMNKMVLPTKKMLQLFAKICGGVTVMLIIHLAVAPPEARTEARIVNGETILKSVCKDNTGDVTFLLTVFVHAFLVLYSAYVAYKIKDVQDDFQESKSIFMGLYNSTVVCIVILPVVLALDLDITVRFILVTIAAVVAFGGTCIGITGAKAFYAAAGSVVPSINNTASDILQSQMKPGRGSSMFNNQQFNQQMSKSTAVSPVTTPPATTGAGAY